MRLGILALNILTIIVIRKTLSVKNDLLYMWILLGLLPVHLGSLSVKTDVPLLFFAAGFFYLYKQYLNNDNFKTVFLLALCTVLMILSKYHGVLVVFFTVLSNPRLFRKRSFYVIIGLALLFMMPHIYWQYKHDYRTVLFHMNEREDLGFKWSNITNYIWMQPVFLGPLIGFVLIAASAIYRSTNAFQKALQFNIAGVFLFFFLLAFKLEIHKHWTSVLEVPLILLGYEYISSRKRWQAVIKNLSIISFIIIIGFRFYLAFDFLPEKISRKIEKLHHWDRWAGKIKSLSGGMPIMFIDQYEQASRYSYLSGKEVHCYNTFDYRESQQDFWGLEDSLQGKDVFALTWNRNNPLYSIDSSEGRVKIQYHTIQNFRSFRNVKIEIDGGEIIDKPGASKILTITLKNNYSYTVDFSKAGNRKVFLNAHFLIGMRPILNQKLDSLAISLSPGGSISKTIMLNMPTETGKYDLRFSIQVEGIDPPINSMKYKVRVQDQ